MVYVDDQNISVMVEGAELPARAHFFQCCHLGLIFYSTTPVPLYKKMKFNLTMEDESGKNAPVDCVGVVVDSNYDDYYEMYKTFFIYTDIDVETQERLKYLARDNELVCPYCMNY